MAEPQLERVVNKARGGLGRTQHRRQSPRAMGTGPTVRGTESEQDLGVASQMAGPSQKVECAWWAARGLSFERVQSPGLRVGPGSEWRQVTGWGLEWEGHIKEEAQGQSPGWGYDSGWGRFELRVGPYWDVGGVGTGQDFHSMHFLPLRSVLPVWSRSTRNCCPRRTECSRPSPRYQGGGARALVDDDCQGIKGTPKTLPPLLCHGSLRALYGAPGRKLQAWRSPTGLAGSEVDAHGRGR